MLSISPYPHGLAKMGKLQSTTMTATTTTKTSATDATETTPLVPSQTTASRPTKRCCIQQALVEPLAIIFLLTNGYTSTLRTQLLYERVAADLNIITEEFNTNSSCGSSASEALEEIQEHTATWVSYLTSAKVIPMVLCTLYFGSLSDKIGRRICLILPALGAILGAAVDIAIEYYQLPPPFFFFEVIEYIFGGTLVFRLGCSAFIADSVSVERRSMRMTILDSLSFASTALSAFLIGKLIPTLFKSFTFVLIGNVVALIYATILIPVSTFTSNIESENDHSAVINRDTGINGDDENDTTTRIGSFWSHLVACIKVYTRNDGMGRRWKLNVLLVAFFISALSATGHIITLYEMNTPLCWDKNTISLFTLEDFLLKSIMMVFVVVVLRRWVADDWLAWSGRVSSCLEHVYLAFCISTPMMFAAPPIGCLNLLTEPMTKSLIVGLVQPAEQGSLLAVFSLAPVLRMASGAAMAPIYKSTLGFIRGAVVFLISASLHFISLIMLSTIIWRRRRCRSVYQAIA